MTPPSERDWAAAHFREYLLGRLGLREAERLGVAVALNSGLIDDLEEVEEELIEAYLDNQLAGDDRVHFEREYVEGKDPENLAKLRVQQALRSPEVQRKLAPPKPVPIHITSRRLLVAVAVAASLAAAVPIALHLRRLEEALTRLQSRTPSLQQNQTPEQPAGLEPDGGVLLPPAASGTTTVRVDASPTRLTWPYVREYRKSYRFRIYAASGEERVSPALKPRANAIAFSPEQAAKLALPWDVFISIADEGDGKFLAHYLLVKP